jgi:HSP20 family protein
MSTSPALHTDRSSARSERVARPSYTVTPFVDVFENADELLLVADVPGASADGVDVHVDDGELTLSARRAPPGEGSVGAERRYDYRRVFALPRGIDGSKIDAELTAGVLRVHLPKSEGDKPRRIEVKAS